MKSRVPCGRTLGHGEYCTIGHLCDNCEELERMRRDLDAAAYREEIAANHITEKDRRVEELEEAITKAVSIEISCNHAEDGRYVLPEMRKILREAIHG